MAVFAFSLKPLISDNLEVVNRILACHNLQESKSGMIPISKLGSFFFDYKINKVLLGWKLITETKTFVKQAKTNYDLSVRSFLV
jgi:hypothetical protein